MELQIEVGGDGWPDRVIVDEAVPKAKPDRCLYLIYRTRFKALGCRWAGRYEWTYFGGGMYVPVSGHWLSVARGGKVAVPPRVAD
jgi:hypothetical protein